jgi:ketosteroid isomerase-like protein
VIVEERVACILGVLLCFSVSEQEAMMSAFENKQIVQSIFDELAQGNSRPLVESMADDFCWTVTGSNRWSGKYEGKQKVLNELLGQLRARIDGRIKTIGHRFIAEGDYVVVEARGNNVTKAGLPYNNAYCFVVRLTDGKLREITEYMDTALVTSVLGDPAA